jgi:hypothetical protein
MTQHSKADGNHGRSAKNRGPKTGTLPQSPGARRDLEAAGNNPQLESRKRKVAPKPSRAKARAQSRSAHN